MRQTAKDQKPSVNASSGTSTAPSRATACVLAAIGGCLIGEFVLRPVFDPPSVAAHLTWLYGALVVAVCMPVALLATAILRPGSMGRWRQFRYAIPAILLIVICWLVAAVGAYLHSELFAVASWLTCVGIAGFLNHKLIFPRQRLGSMAWLFGLTALMGVAGMVVTLLNPTL